MRSWLARLAYNFLDVANRDNNRPFIPNYVEDIKKLISTSDWKVVVSTSRKVYANLGVVSGAVKQKSMYSVGHAWKPVFKGQDKEWGQKATEWLVDVFYPLCDVKGSSFDFVSNLRLDSIQLDVSGDFGIILVSTTTGFPQTRRVAADEIGWRGEEGLIKDGKYSGNKVYNGVIMNPQGRAIAYCVLGDTEEEDRIINANNFIHVFDPICYSQARGFPSLTPALNTWRSFITCKEYEEQACMLASSIGLLEYNDTGLASPNHPASRMNTTTPTGDPISTATFGGGMIKYFKANSGGKVESMKSDRPGDAWEKFQDRLIRDAAEGMNWPYELVWKSGELTGVAIRAVLGRAEKAIQDRQFILRKAATRVVSFAIRKAIMRGDLPDNDEWMKWDFTLPKKLSIDAGRDAQAIREDYSAGIKNLTKILGEEGVSLEEHLAERAHENKRIEEVLGGLGVNDAPEANSATPNGQDNIDNKNLDESANISEEEDKIKKEDDEL